MGRSDARRANGARCGGSVRDAVPPSGSVRTRLPASLLRAFVAERRTGLESRTTASAQAEDPNSMRRHLAVDRRRVARQMHVERDQEGRLLATPSPRLDSRNQLPEEMHRSRGNEPRWCRRLAGCAAANPAARLRVGNARLMPRSIGAALVESKAHSIAHRVHRLTRNGPAMVRAGIERIVDLLGLLHKLSGTGSNRWSGRCAGSMN